MTPNRMPDETQFEALLQDALHHRANAPAPAGLEQRLLARFAQEPAVSEPGLTAQKARASIHAVQFRDFGVLNPGRSSRGAFLTSVLTNAGLLALMLVLGTLVKNKITAPKSNKDISFVEAVKPPPPPPPPVIKLPPPPRMEVPAVEPPKIKLPDPLPAPEIKPVAAPVPKVNIAAPAPGKIDPPPAPKVVSLAAKASAASVINNDPHPSAVRLGSTNSPISSSMTGPAVSRVNMSAGMSGMPPANSGSGPRATSVNMGNGSPQGTNLSGRSVAAIPVKGLSDGVAGGTGAGRNGPVAVQIAPPQQLQQVAKATAVASPLAKRPEVTYQPKPIYTAEAKSAHLEGDATVRVNFLATGAIQVLGIAHGLGHGLDESALTAAQGIRFKPATDAAGHPIDYPTTITVHFLMN